MGFSREQLESFRGASVPDLIGPVVRLLLVGVNPGLWTAATQTHFARPGNRFYPSLYAAGLTDHVIEASAGLSPADTAALLERGLAITNLVSRATARADELTRPELRGGAERLLDLVQRTTPAVVVMLGITAYRLAFGRPHAARGRQPEGIGDAVLYVLGNPSGLNAHETVATLADGLHRAATEAGISPVRPPAGHERRPAP